MRVSFRIAVLSLFFLSGVCGLVYEISWMRMFRLVMGNTVYTSAMVLTVFMAGLALGAYVAGRYIDRVTSPLKLYGFLELAVGLYGLVMPLLFAGFEPVYEFLYHRFVGWPTVLGIGRFVVSALLLISPTILMGATLPLLSRFISQRRESMGRDVGRLYAFNTLGAAVGAACTGFLLVPFLGVHWTVVGAALTNLAIGVVAIGLARGSGAVESETRHGEESPPSGAPAWAVGNRSVLLGLAGAGFASMIYEVAWTRILSLLIGSSVYAFSLMLVAFIAGLGAGSLVLAGWIDRRRNLLVFLGFLQLLAGLAAMLVVPLFNRLPSFTVDLVTRYSTSFAVLHLLEFVAIFLLMLVPTFAMGGIFPLVAKLYTRDFARVGQSVGDAYAANTIGAVLGSFIAGFLLIPAIGGQYTILLAVGVNLAIGSYFVLVSKWGSQMGRWTVVTGACTLVLAWSFFIPQWDPVLMNSAPYLYAYRYKGKAVQQEADLTQVMTQNRRLLYAEEGVTANVTVVESGDEIYLKVNGKTDASSRGDLRSQSLLAHLPLLLHPQPDQVLLVGLGSGISLGAAQRHPIQEIECVEISPEVVEGARFFSEVNYQALQDPRLNLIVGDGRNHVAMSQSRYDVIISQPSNLWIAGMADLFTTEFFSACRQQLAEGGVMCSWVQAYSMREEDFKTILNTFQRVFPHASLWESIPGGDYFLVGSNDEIAFHPSSMKARVEQRQLESDFVRIGVGDALNLACSLVMQSGQIDQFVQGADINTDDNAILEFSAPKGMYQGAVGGHGIFGLESLESIRLKSPPPGPQADELLQAAWKARQAALRAQKWVKQEQYDQALTDLVQARQLNEADRELHRLFGEVGQKIADQFMARQDFQGALDMYRRIVAFYPERGIFYVQMGDVLEKLNRSEEALGAYHEAVLRNPGLGAAYLNMARLYSADRMFEQAAKVCRQGLEISPGNLGLLGALAKIYLGQKHWQAAIAQYQKALAIDPDNAQFNNNLGVVYFQMKDFEQALVWFEKAADLNPSYARAFSNMGDAYRALGKRGKARIAFERALELEPQNMRVIQNLQRLQRAPL
ncbi:MAG: tetratricopeptide repeat protein [Candidatus Latescibacteria bacterium]|nr:tetratricopeptide repeat protein [Candidatus Latescibacterota bacterium]